MKREFIREAEVLGENLTLEPLCLPRIPHELAWNRNRTVAKPVTNLPSYITASTNICHLQAFIYCRSDSCVQNGTPCIVGQAPTHKDSYMCCIKILQAICVC
jgi:hypothetical protein